MSTETGPLSTYPRRETLGAALAAAVDRWGDTTGWVFEDQRISFAEMNAAADAVAGALLASGVGQGDVVALWTGNIPEFAHAMYGCARIGAIAAPVNIRSRSFELSNLLADSGAKALIFAEPLGDGRLDAILNTSLSEHDFPGISLIVEIGTNAGAHILWKDFLRRADQISAHRLADATSKVGSEDPVLLQYTSGTTASPKGALLNHVYVLNFGTELCSRLGVGEGESFLNTQPFYHVGGSCGALPVPLTLGCIIVSPGHYEPLRILELIERERCVSRSGYGAMYVTELNHPRFGDFDISSLRSGWCVGTPALLNEVRDRMGIDGLVQIYGSTEAGGTGGSIDEPWEKRSTTCGKPVTGVELRIIDPDTGAELPANQVGEIVLGGWWRMNEYLGRPMETRKVVDPKGRIRTGDLGFLDEDGYLHFSGRIKEMLKVGGENVSPLEVESVLLTHPDVAQAAVIGMPDPRLNEVVLAAVKLRAGGTVREQELIEFCRKRMAGFRVPREVRFVSSFPVTDSGKIQKRLLAEQLGSDE
ncbi:MAG: acyl--CoA ligase [Rhizobiaceae bacterium]|nr:acyl--CoA ligase [Rhizobiaceae bacterium]